MFDIETLRLFVNERLTAVAEDILAVCVRTILQYQQQIDLQHRQLKFLIPQVTSDLTDFLPVCEENKSPEQQERRSDLLQEEPQPPQIKDEQQELILRPEQAEGSTLKIIAVKSEYNENRETEPQASTSNERVKTQADVDNCGASRPTVNVQLISSHCSESDTEDSDDWEETREDQSLKSPKTHTAEGQIFSLKNKQSQDLISVRQTPTMRAHTRERTFSCTVCGKTFNRNGNLKRHTRTHTDFLPVCEEEKSPEQQERRPDLLQEEPQPPQMNGEQRELIHRPEEAEGSTLTLLAATSGYNDNRETEPLASNHFISSHCSESDTEDSDECEETREDKSLKTQTTHTVEGRRFSLRNKLSQDLISLRLTPSMRAHKIERTFSCTVCGKTFSQNANLKRHARTHTDFLPVCKEEKSPEQQERRPDLLQEEPQPPQKKDEQQQLIYRQEEAEGSTQTLLAVKSEYNENTETPLAGKQFMSSQSHCSESDAEDSDECEKTREDKSLKTHSTRSVEGRRFSFRNKLSQDSCPRTWSGRQTFSCTVCGKTFNRNGNLKRHTHTHTRDLQLYTLAKPTSEESETPNPWGFIM